MIIEVGKYYKTRDGRDVGPMASFGLGFRCENSKFTWHPDGSAASGTKNSSDIVSEWVEPKSPIKITQKREIVDGDYGAVRVKNQNNVDFPIQITLLGGTTREPVMRRGFNAEQLREAAHIFNQIAEALGDE